MHDAEHLLEVAKDDTTMEGDVVEGETEVMYLTPSKVVHRQSRKNICAHKMKSSFVVTTDTREQLKNTLSVPDKFDKKRLVLNDITIKKF